MPTPRVIAPIARVRHFGGLASGIGVSSQTTFGEGSSSRARVEPVSLVFATAEEEPSTGKDAGLTSNNELIDWGDVESDDVSAVSIVGSWDLEEWTVRVSVAFFRADREWERADPGNKSVAWMGEYKDRPKPGTSNRALLATTETNPARVARRNPEPTDGSFKRTRTLTASKDLDEKKLIPEECSFLAISQPAKRVRHSA
jgi:hypothetical protein